MYPTAANDNDINTYAVVGAAWQTWNSDADPPPLDWTTLGDCRWGGFPSAVLTAAATLHCIAQAFDNSNGGTWTGRIVVTIAGVATTLVTFSAASGEADHTMTVPSGTDLSTVAIEATVEWSSPGSAPSTVGDEADGSAQICVSEIYIQ